MAKFKKGDNVIVDNLNRYSSDPGIGSDMPSCVGKTYTIQDIIDTHHSYVGYYFEEDSRHLWDERWLKLVDLSIEDILKGDLVWA